MARIPDSVAAFLSGRRFAVAGVSRDGNLPANAIFRKLKASGYDAVPVNPNADDGRGRPLLPEPRRDPGPRGRSRDRGAPGRRRGPRQAGGRARRDAGLVPPLVRRGKRLGGGARRVPRRRDHADRGRLPADVLRARSTSRTAASGGGSASGDACPRDGSPRRDRPRRPSPRRRRRAGVRGRALALRTRNSTLRSGRRRPRAARGRSTRASSRACPRPCAGTCRSPCAAGSPSSSRRASRRRASSSSTRRRSAGRPFTADQLVTVRPPGFDWDARIRMLPGLSVFVRDAYREGAGLLRAEAAGLVTVADLPPSPDLARGELLRWLAEAPWFPTALLPSQGVRWEALAEDRARGDDRGSRRDRLGRVPVRPRRSSRVGLRPRPPPHGRRGERPDSVGGHVVGLRARATGCACRRPARSRGCSRRGAFPTGAGGRVGRVRVRERGRRLDREALNG